MSFREVVHRTWDVIWDSFMSSGEDKIGLPVVITIYNIFLKKLKKLSNFGTIVMQMFTPPRYIKYFFFSMKSTVVQKGLRHKVKDCVNSLLLFFLVQVLCTTIFVLKWEWAGKNGSYILSSREGTLVRTYTKHVIFGTAGGGKREQYILTGKQAHTVTGMLLLDI